MSERAEEVSAVIEGRLGQLDAIKNAWKAIDRNKPSIEALVKRSVEKDLPELAALLDTLTEDNDERLWWCGHLERLMPERSRDRQYCLQGHLVSSTVCGWQDTLTEDEPVAAFRDTPHEHRPLYGSPCKCGHVNGKHRWATDRTASNCRECLCYEYRWALL